MSKQLIDFLSKIKIEISKKIYYYIYFDNTTQKIEKITKEKDLLDNFKFIKVELSEVEDFINGKKRFEDYRVIYSSKFNNFVLTEIKNVSKIKDINEKIFKIPKLIKNKSYNIVIQQDNNKKCWNFFINKQLKFTEDLNDSFFFMITKKNDPNILYKTINFNKNNLVDNCVSVPYTYKVEESLTNLSIYTNKTLNTYAHEVKND
jgi:hypothetical protein